MKTNQLMNIAFPNGTLNIYHKSQMGNLKDVFKFGEINIGFWKIKSQ